MGSTNKTTNLQLPQWIGTDKPTFLGDMNDAFLKIDNGYGEIDGNSTTAVAQAGQAVSKATDALEKAETAQSTAETAQSTATSANETANNALTTANSAQGTAQTANTGVANVKNWISGNMSVNKIQTSAAFANYNKDLNLLNIVLYSGNANTISSGEVVATLPSAIVSALNLTEDRTLYAIGNVEVQGSGGQPFGVVLKPNGNIVSNNTFNYTRYAIQCILCTATW